MFNIVAILFLILGAATRRIAEWIYGTPSTPEYEVDERDTEMSVEELLELIQENYRDDMDGGASQEDFENFLEEEEAKNKKVH